MCNDNARKLDVAVVTTVFPTPDDGERLDELLVKAREKGAELAVLPELPLHPWSPISRTPRPEDAEPPGGPRHQRLAEAARRAGIGVLGGVIAVDEASGERRNRTLVFDERGELVMSYDKIHLPSEEGWWESDHYRPGGTMPRPVTGLGLAFGVQVCSDVQRPAGANILAARGAEVIFVPRATPHSTYERWWVTLRATAVSSCAWVVSANRPRLDSEPDMGGASIVVAPDGRVVLESEEPLAVVRLDGAAVDAARLDYPGYVDVRADLYGAAWTAVASEEDTP